MAGCPNTPATRPLASDALTTWSVSADGSRVRLGFSNGQGRPRCLDLPLEAISGLLMTLPRILQRALDARGDGSSRVVQPLGAWRLEQAAGDGRLILTLTTPDGFAVTFALAPGELAAMAEAGQAHAAALAGRELN